MKRFFFLFVLWLITLSTSAQNYRITFTGEGASNNVNTVEVNNLTTGESLIMDANDTLVLKGPVGNSYLITDQCELMVSPNPFNETSIITFYSKSRQKATVEVYNLPGALQISEVFEFNEGSNSIKLSGLKKGVHLLKINGRDINTSAKIISLSNAPASPSIKLLESIPGPGELKSAGNLTEMLYHTGDQMLYKGINGIYSTIVTDVPESSKRITFGFVECTDADTNHYTTVQIADQRWMAENLNVGHKILGKWNQSNNSIIEKYCYNDLIENCDLYGGLYQWNEIKKFEYLSVQGICPENWRIPTLSELSKLAENLGGVSVAGGKLKEVRGEYWSFPNTGASNSSGFSALPGGMRNSAKTFNDLSLSGRFWSLTERPLNMVPVLSLNNESGEFTIGEMPKDEGYSVRCIHCDSLIFPGVTIAADENPVMFFEQATIRATPVNGGTNPSYKWKRNGCIVGYDSSVYTYWPSIGDTISCEMTSNAICISGNPVKSNLIPIEITGPPCPGTPSIVYDGETYNTVLIGTQCWLTRNLNVGYHVGHYCGLITQHDNGVIEKYCYENNAARCDELGGLYLWAEAMNYAPSSSTNPSNVQGICPQGWHIPSKDEVCELAMFLDPNFNCVVQPNYDSYSGGMLKEAGYDHWFMPNSGATNVTGFNALPAGWTGYDFADFYDYGYSTYIWTTTQDGYPNCSSTLNLFKDYTYIRIKVEGNLMGASVRCIKD